MSHRSFSFALVLVCTVAALVACGDDDASSGADAGTGPDAGGSADMTVPNDIGTTTDDDSSTTTPPPPPVPPPVPPPPATEGACAVADVTSCGEIAEPATGCCQPDGVAVFCDGDRLVETDCANHRTTCGPVSDWAMNHCVPTGAGRCADVVAPRTTGAVLEYGTIDVIWDMACWDDADGSLFVFLEDYDRDDIALRFRLYPGAMGAPAVGETTSLGRYSALANPFFVSMLSGIAFDEGGSYDAEFLAYAGTVTIESFDAGSPVGSTLRMVFEDVWGREVNITRTSCGDVENGRRMHIRRLAFEVTVGALHSDAECIEWAGG